MINLEGNIAIVTGGSDGIGRSIVYHLAKAGSDIVVIDNNKQALDEMKESIDYQRKILFYYADVTDRKAIRNVVNQVTQKLGSASILVNNAGILIRGEVGNDNALDTWDKTIQVNLTGAFNVSHAFLNSLKETKGVIVNISSIHSFIAVKNSVAYTASKGGLAQMTKALALELASYGIRVNAVAPGLIETKMTTQLRRNETNLNEFLKRIPLSRAGKPSEVAYAVLFLASNFASYITGVTLPVDAGYVAN